MSYRHVIVPLNNAVGEAMQANEQSKSNRGERNEINQLIFDNSALKIYRRYEQSSIHTILVGLDAERGRRLQLFSLYVLHLIRTYVTFTIIDKNFSSL